MSRPRMGTPQLIGLTTLFILGAMAATAEALKWLNGWLDNPEPLPCEGRWRSGWVESEHGGHG